MVDKHEGKWSLYRHTSPSGKVYIGVTSQDVKTRWHYGSGYYLCKYFYRAIQKYGWNNIKHEVLFTGLSEDRAKRLEIDLIRHYKNLGISYNLTAGGDGWLGFHHSEETKKKMSTAKTGRKLSEETKKKMSEARMGRPGTMKGKHHTLETRAKMSAMRKGRTVIYRIPKEELSRKFREAQKDVSIPVVQLSLSGEFIREYPSIGEAARAIEASRNHISECCVGKLKTYKGYIWRKNYDKRNTIC